MPNIVKITIGVRYIFSLSKVEPTEITSSLRNPENSRLISVKGIHVARGKNCTTEKKKKRQKRKKKGYKKAVPAGVVGKLGGKIMENLARGCHVWSGVVLGEAARRCVGWRAPEDGETNTWSSRDRARNKSASRDSARGEIFGRERCPVSCISMYVCRSRVTKSVPGANIVAFSFSGGGQRSR